MTNDEVIAKWKDDPAVLERLTDTGRLQQAWALELQELAAGYLDHPDKTRQFADIMTQARGCQKAAMVADEHYDKALEARALDEAAAADELERGVVKLVSK